MFESGFEVVDDFLGEDVGVGEIIRFFESFVSEPEDVEAGFVAVDEFLVFISAPPTCKLACLSVARRQVVSQVYVRRRQT